MTSRLLLFRGLLPLFALVGTLHAVPTKFDIPAQPAPSALRLFLKQSGTEVLFIQEDLANATTNAVTGEYEPESALNALLLDTGFAAKKGRGGKFTVVSTKPLPGAIEGSIREEKSGRPVANARVQLAGTDKLATTDKRGRFVLEDVIAGSQILLVAADGMQNTRVTDVSVSAGHRLSLSPIGIPVAQSGTLQLDTYTVSAKKNDGVLELDPFAVSGSKPKPFTDRSIDIPRTINDVQPYVIFGRETIERSGVTNLEELLGRQLPMNHVARTNAQTTTGNLLGNTSQVDLRGLGSAKTLVLVNGRRMPGVSVGQATERISQPDLNGIPLDAVERIEILPTSSSGIYGGSAIGGVINVILKKNFAGGELRLSYDNTFDTDSPQRSIALNYGKALANGKTHVFLSAQYSDEKPLYLKDRRKVFEQYLNVAEQNQPALFTSSRQLFLGALPNIAALDRFATTLTLKDGTVLPSRHTFVPAGTSTSTPTTALYAGLLANAGQINRDFPDSTLFPTGLLRPYAVAPAIRSYQATIEHQLYPQLSLFAEMMRAENASETVFNPIANIAFANVPASAPTNPFTTAVRVRVPDKQAVKWQSRSVTESYTIGLRSKLWNDATLHVEYTHGRNRYRNRGYMIDETAINTALASGELNPFVDIATSPLDTLRYMVPETNASRNTLDSVVIKGSTELLTLWRITPRTTIGYEHQIAKTPANETVAEWPLTPINNSIQYYFPRKQVNDAGHAELLVPLNGVSNSQILNSIEVQIAGRLERFSVDTGTHSRTTLPNLTPPVVTLSPFSMEGEPVFSTAAYTSSNGTVGLSCRPHSTVILRASRSTAFLPPVPSQLVRDSIPNPFYMPTISDPRTGENYEVEILGGGNPDLKPETSKSWNLGVVWELPRKDSFRIRVNAEYYRIEQFGAIQYPVAQEVVDNEGTVADRVVRDASGLITRLDLSAMNLFRRDTAGWDFSAQLSIPTTVGTLNLQGTQSLMKYNLEQFSATSPESDRAGRHPADGGAGPKRQAVANVTFERNHWHVGWALQHVAKYDATQDEFIRSAQNSDIVPSQTYHDVFLGFGSLPKRVERTDNMIRRLLGNYQVQLGVRNVFNKAPPMDVGYIDSYMMSPYGNLRMRRYWLSVKRNF